MIYPKTRNHVLSVMALVVEEELILRSLRLQDLESWGLWL